jgi:succinyl-diaminopimelate desuccinylase
LRSVTPDDGGCQDVLTQRPKTIGFEVERLPFGKVANFWARRGRAAPTLCFAGHTDVVPPGPLDQWTSEPFSPQEREGKLYGRGAADMKSSLAAFTVATERFVAQHPDHPGSIAFLITSDEEGDAVDGTVKVVESLAARGERFEWCVVGEPTCNQRLGDTVKNGRRGSLSGALRVIGIQGHVAYPQYARNPIHLALPALVELAATEWDKGNEHFPPTTLQISEVRAGARAGNVIPGELFVSFNFRYGTASTTQDLTRRVHKLLERHKVDHEIQWTLAATPYLTAGGRLLDALRTAIGEIAGFEAELATSGGTSDGRFMAAISREVVEFGPLNESIHKANECIALADLEPLTRIYTRLLEQLLLAR